MIIVKELFVTMNIVSSFDYNGEDALYCGRYREEINISMSI